MKEYNAYETGSLVHTVRVTLMQEDYIGHVSLGVQQLQGCPPA